MSDTFDIQAARKLARDHMDLEFDLSHTLAEACDEVERIDGLVLLAAGLAVGAVMRAIARQDPEDDGWGGYND